MFFLCLRRLTTSYVVSLPQWACADVNERECECAHSTAPKTHRHTLQRRLNSLDSFAKNVFLHFFSQNKRSLTIHTATFLLLPPHAFTLSTPALSHKHTESFPKFSYMQYMKLSWPIWKVLLCRFICYVMPLDEMTNDRWRRRERERESSWTNEIDPLKLYYNKKKKINLIRLEYWHTHTNERTGTHLAI